MDEPRQQRGGPDVASATPFKPVRDAVASRLPSTERVLDAKARCTSLASCLEVDRLGGHRPLLHRQRYLTHALQAGEGMYSSDIRGHIGCVNAVAFSNLGEHFLASGGDGECVKVWRVGEVINKRGSPIALTNKHQSNIFAVAFGCDNRYVFSGGNDSDVIKHDFETGRMVSSYEHLEAVYSISPHPSSPDLILTASEDGSVNIVDTRRPRMSRDMLLLSSSYAYQSVAFNPAEPRLAAMGNTRKGTSLFDIRQRNVVVQYRSASHSSCPFAPPRREDTVSVCFNSSGSQLYTMQRDLPPCVFDIWNPQPKHRFGDDPGSYRNSVTMKSGCFVGTNDEYVSSGSDDFRIYIWKLPKDSYSAVDVGQLGLQPTVSPFMVLPGHRSIVNQVRYSPNHQLMCSSGVEKVIKLWSPFPLHEGCPFQPSYGPPSRSLYSQADFLRLTLDSQGSPEDHLDEDPSVLAFFDALVSHDDHRLLSDSEDDFSDDSSLDGFTEYDSTDSSLDASSDEAGLHLSYLDVVDWSDSTSSSLSPANTSSLEAPWSESDSLLESDINGWREWGGYDSSGSEEENDGSLQPPATERACAASEGSSLDAETGHSGTVGSQEPARLENAEPCASASTPDTNRVAVSSNRGKGPKQSGDKSKRPSEKPSGDNSKQSTEKASKNSRDNSRQPSAKAPNHSDDKGKQTAPKNGRDTDKQSSTAEPSSHASPGSSEDRKRGPPLPSSGQPRSKRPCGGRGSEATTYRREDFLKTAISPRKFYSSRILPSSPPSSQGNSSSATSSSRQGNSLAASGSHQGSSSAASRSHRGNSFAISGSHRGNSSSATSGSRRGNLASAISGSRRGNSSSATSGSRRGNSSSTISGSRPGDPSSSAGLSVASRGVTEGGRGDVVRGRGKQGTVVGPSGTSQVSPVAHQPRPSPVARGLRRSARLRSRDDACDEPSINGVEDSGGREAGPSLEGEGEDGGGGWSAGRSSVHERRRK